MRAEGKLTRKTGWRFLALTTVVLAAALMAACQPAAPVAPTAAPKPAAPTAAPAAPTAAAPAAAATAAPAQGAAKTVTVKIGFMPAFTGAIASQSEPQSQAAADYFQEINAAGGFEYKDPKTGQTARAKLDVVWEDTGYEVPRILSIYQRHKQAGVKGMLTYGSSSAVNLAETASKDKMPIFAIGSPNDAVLKVRPGYVTTFGNFFDMQSKSFVKWAKDNWKESRAPKLGIAYTDAAFGQLIIAGLPEFAQKLGWEVLKPEAIQEPATDTSIQAKRLIDGQPDWVVGGITAAANTVMLKDMARLGLKDKTKWVALSYAFDPTTFQQLADTATDGVYGWAYWAAETETNVPGVAEAAKASQQYRNKPLSNIYLQGRLWAAVFVLGGIKGALEKVGYDDLTSEAVNNSLHSVKGLDVGGALPPVTITEDAPWVMSKARLVQWKDHKVNVLSDWQEGSVR